MAMIPDPWARWRAKAAVSYAASLVDLTGNGRDLTTGVQPPWSTFKGWRFDGASHLITPFVPGDQDLSIFVQFSNFVGYGSILGMFELGNGLYLSPNAEGQVEYSNGGGAKDAAPELLAGNLAIAGDTGYRDGAEDVTGLNDWLISPTLACYIGAPNVGGVPWFPVTADVQEVRIYDLILTDKQVAKVADKMARMNRETVRDALAALLETEMVNGSPQLAQSVYNYQKFDLKGKSPSVLVYSGGSQRPRMTLAGGRSEFQIWVAMFVTTTASGGYTEADAEDRLDRLEQALADVVEANRETANWQHLDYDGRSLVQDVEIGGVPYIAEYVPLAVRVFG